MDIDIKTVDYIISVCKTMNRRLNIARDYMVYKSSKNKEDKKKLKDLIENNKYFKTEKEIVRYYRMKQLQIKKYHENLKDSDQKNGIAFDDMCRIIYKDVIMDDEFLLKEAKNEDG